MLLIRTRILAILGVMTLLVTILALTASTSSAAPIVSLQLRVTEAANGAELAPLSGSHGRIELPNGEYHFELVADAGVARMRMEARNADCPLGRPADVAKPDDPTTNADDTWHPRFRSGVITAAGADMSCEVVFNAWYENHKWAGHLFVDVVFSAPREAPPAEPESTDPELRRRTITIGTSGATAMDMNTPIVAEAAHGVRVYCPISHLSYDDPIVHPGEPDATHLHVFWGNTSTDANSTAGSLLGAPTSSCEGGSNNGSAYWMPAFFNEDGEVMLPDAAITYYKSFGSNGSFDRTTIQPIPNGLEMIADANVTNGGPWNLKVDGARVRGVNVVRFNISFPQCVAVDAAGDPVLRTPYPHTDHLAYARGGSNSNHCPNSHPYRIPQLIYNVRYAADINSGWSLSSPHLHADYIAAWDVESMDRLTRCNIERRYNCQFRDSAGRLRTQLPERFRGADGAAVYTASDQLAPGVDRTPFGRSLTKMAN